MARSIEKEAKTVDEAIALALEELGVEQEDVDIEILESGSKAVLGIFGGGKGGGKPLQNAFVSVFGRYKCN